MKLPQDTETTKYLEWPQYESITMLELMQYADKFFPDVDCNRITVDRLEIQVDCFGYDLYDPNDYRWYYVFEVQ